MEDLPGLKSAIATVLRRVRREARLSQQKLADFAGLSRIHIAQLEGRRQNATLNVLLLIAMALNLDGLSLLRMIHEEMLRTGHGRRKSVRRKAERQDEPHQEALPKETKTVMFFHIRFFPLCPLPPEMNACRGTIRKSPKHKPPGTVNQAFSDAGSHWTQIERERGPSPSYK